MLSVGGVDLLVDSVGGLGTCVQLPSWRLAFDIGRSPRGAERCRRVLFSHAHCDHMGGVVHHCATRDLQGMSPPEYWMPAENVEDFEQLMEVWRRLDGSALPCTVVGVRGGEAHELRRGRRVHVVKTEHRIPSAGYVLVERRKRLRADLIGTPGPELRALREAGEEIHDQTEAPVLAYTGDTTLDALEREPLLCQARVLVMEITFLDDRVSPANAHRLGHVHLDDVIDRAGIFDNEVIVAIHLSARYGVQEARDILRRRLPPSLEGRVYLAGRPG